MVCGEWVWHGMTCSSHGSEVIAVDRLTFAKWPVKMFDNLAGRIPDHLLVTVCELSSGSCPTCGGRHGLPVVHQYLG